MKKIICVIVLMGLPFTVTLAESRWVFGAGGSLHSFESGNDALNPVNVYMRVGLAVNEMVEFGAEISTTLADDDIGAADFDIDTTFVFIKANLQLDNGVVLYGLLGRSSIELTERRGNFTANTDDAGFGYGFGAQFGRSNQSAYTIDYISYYDDDEFDSVTGDTVHGGLNFGYVSYF